MSEDEAIVRRPAADDADPAAASFTIVYDELKRVASHHLRAISAGATQSTTELVHEG